MDTISLRGSKDYFISLQPYNVFSNLPNMVARELTKKLTLINYLNIKFYNYNKVKKKLVLIFQIIIEEWFNVRFQHLAYISISKIL